jgi:hypothetical protein
MFPSSDALAMFPSNDSVIRHPLPFPGSLRVRFSWFGGTMGCSDALGPCRRASFAFAWRYPPVRLSLSLPAARRRPRAWSFRVWQPHASLYGQEILSGSWGTPVCLCPVLGPRQDCSVRPYDVCSMAPANGKTKAPTIRRISGLDRRAWARAVYASSPGLPQDNARLASGCLASFPGGIGYPQGSYERFPVCFLHPVLLSQTCLTQATFRRQRGEHVCITEPLRSPSLTTWRWCPPRHFLIHRSFVGTIRTHPARQMPEHSWSVEVTPPAKLSGLIHYSVHCI